MKCIQILFATAFLSSAFTTQGAEQPFCKESFCWFSKDDNPLLKVPLKRWDNWYTHEEHWTSETEVVGKSGKCSIVKNNCIPILNIVPLPIKEWSEKINGMEALIFNLMVAPYSYAKIMRTPNINAYVRKENYEKHQDQALYFISKKTTSLPSKTQKEIDEAGELIKQYIALISEATVPCWHDCPGLIVPLRSVLAITTITSIAETQKL